jgi:hypothetical protein
MRKIVMETGTGRIESTGAAEKGAEIGTAEGRRRSDTKRTTGAATIKGRRSM